MITQIGIFYNFSGYRDTGLQQRHTGAYKANLPIRHNKITYAQQVLHGHHIVVVVNPIHYKAVFHADADTAPG